MDQETCLLLYHLTKKETPGIAQGNNQITKGLGLLHEVSYITTFNGLTPYF